MSMNAYQVKEPKQATLKEQSRNKDADARGHMLLPGFQGLDLGGSRGGRGRAWHGQGPRPTATTAWKRQHGITAKSRATTIRHPLRLNNACTRRTTVPLLFLQVNST